MAGGRNPSMDLDLDEADGGQLAFPDPVVGARHSPALRLAGEHEQLDGHAGPGAGLGEGFVAQRGEALVGGAVHEIERERAAGDDRGQSFERQARLGQAADQARLADLPAGEPIVRGGMENAELDPVGQVVFGDPGSFGRLTPGVVRHGTSLPPVGGVARHRSPGAGLG